MRNRIGAIIIIAAFLFGLYFLSMSIATQFLADGDYAAVTEKHGIYYFDEYKETEDGFFVYDAITTVKWLPIRRFTTIDNVYLPKDDIDWIADRTANVIGPLPRVYDHSCDD